MDAILKEMQWLERDMENVARTTTTYARMHRRWIELEGKRIALIDERLKRAGV